MAKPIKNYNEKGISIAKWQGRDATSFYFTLQKTFKDKNSGEYKKTDFLFESDLSIIKRLVGQALGEIEHAPATEESNDQW
jgi:hypothetical protein